MTQQELMYAMALRARELADYADPLLRIRTGRLPEGVRHRDVTRGELIEKILVEEFEDRIKEED